MSLTSYSYAKLHLFILAPLAFLYLIPPRPLSDAHPPQVRRVGYAVTLILGIVALVYSVTGWDRILYQAGVVSCASSYGSLLSVPYEEWIWCVDHTALVCLWVMSIWKSHPAPTKTRESAHVGFRLMATIACLALAYYGYVLQNQGKHFFYLGLTLLHTFPIIALHFATVGHMYLRFAREYALGVLVPSLYVLAIDTYAIHKGIWKISEDFTTGIFILGVSLEHLLIYTLTTALASETILAFLRFAEIYHHMHAVRKGKGTSFLSMVLGIWGSA
jgi:lycopene cyclase domain-containing protein